MLTRKFVAKKIVDEKIVKKTFRIVKLKNDKELKIQKKLFDNEKIDIILDVKNQQFRRNEIRAMCNDKNYYKIFFETLLIKLIEMQIKNLIMQKIRKQLILKN